jgi:hypothetical protein
VTGPSEPMGSLSRVGRALHRGVHEVAIPTAEFGGNPYLEARLPVTYTRPDGTDVTVDAFYDGNGVYKARAYCDQLGVWRWRWTGNTSDPGANSGSFQVIPSSLPGKLRVHRGDPYQFAYDNGDWFLHIGDTGYRYVVASEPKWRAYIDQAAQMGATKIRTWFCEGRSDVQVLFADGRETLNLPYWQEIDRRVVYALEHHPRVILKLIPYGEDTDEIRRYAAGDPASRLIARYAQARFSAFPNVYWCITNDREIVEDSAQTLAGRQVYADTIRQMGRDMAGREPWGTLLTNHQCRWSGYTFAGEPWSDVITIEDMDQVHGAVIGAYRQLDRAPVVNDEDRYELYRPPAHPRYFFRRLMWGSLFSGGHATYGGLRTYEPYDGAQQGVQGYYDARSAGTLQGGGDDFCHIHGFFGEAGLTLVNMEPDDALVGGDPARWKCIHDAQAWLVYVANPTGDERGTDDVAAAVPDVRIDLPEGGYEVRWYGPSTGRWYAGERVTGGTQSLAAPGAGDWVLWLSASE